MLWMDEYTGDLCHPSIYKSLYTKFGIIKSFYFTVPVILRFDFCLNLVLTNFSLVKWKLCLEWKTLCLFIKGFWIIKSFRLTFLSKIFYLLYWFLLPFCKCICCKYFSTWANFLLFSWKNKCQLPLLEKKNPNIVFTTCAKGLREGKG